MDAATFDEKAKAAQNLLKVDTPFGSGIEKWELPIDMKPMKTYKTIFPPNTYVAPYIHPENNSDDPGGSLRIVFSGRIFYEDKEYTAGDWFFVPNGESYEFLTDPEEETIVFYTYRFFGVEQGNRFSHPHHTEKIKSKEKEISK